MCWLVATVSGCNCEHTVSGGGIHVLAGCRAGVVGWPERHGLKGGHLLRCWWAPLLALQGARGVGAPEPPCPYAFESADWHVAIHVRLPACCSNERNRLRQAACASLAGAAAATCVLTNWLPTLADVRRGRSRSCCRLGTARPPTLLPCRTSLRSGLLILVARSASSHSGLLISIASGASLRASWRRPRRHGSYCRAWARWAMTWHIVHACSAARPPWLMAAHPHSEGMVMRQCFAARHCHQTAC